MRQPQADVAADNGDKPIKLFQLSFLFVIKSSYWSCRIGSEPQNLYSPAHEAESQACLTDETPVLPRSARRSWSPRARAARSFRGKTV
jgi:hypothetical protein